MEINKLEMISFRNHKKTNISFNPGLTIIWGKNGSGKTSVLEAIHSLSYGKSFRTNNKNDLIKILEDRKPSQILYLGLNTSYNLNSQAISQKNWINQSLTQREQFF